MASFQLVGLPFEPFAPLFALSDRELSERSARRVVASGKPGFPCRVSLRDAEVGEELLLLHYPHQPASSPYKASGPIYVRKGAQQQTLEAGAVPDYVRCRLMSTRAYDAAQNQRRIGNYPAAIASFQNFVAQYPKSPLAHRAQYWIGDSQYNLRDFKSAIASQHKLIAGWSDSASVPDALLNIASCQIELGDSAAARKTLDGLVARYPASDAAEKARRRLATLK